MGEFQRVCGSDNVKPGELRTAFYGVKRVVLTRLDGAVHAFSNACPHAGSPLSGGRMQGDCVVCPRHAWRFRVTDGECQDQPMYDLRLYIVEERDDGVWVKPAIEEIW